MRFSKIVLVLSLLNSPVVMAVCPSVDQPGFKEAAHKYMEAQGLIRESEEMNFPELKLTIGWQAYKVVDYKSHCLVVMANASGMDLQNHFAHAAYEVFGYDLKKKKFVSFESLAGIPKKMIVKIGDPPDQDRKLGYYYVELTGASVVHALKSVLTKTVYGGFSGVAVLGEKASFDPTPNRNWKIEDGQYDLRRGMTGETMDIQSFQFDGLGGGPGELYWQGCNNPKMTYGYCSVAPWGQAAINEIVEIK